jgi:hypothetical protein
MRSLRLQTLAALIVLAVLAANLSFGLPPNDDFYPASEAAERKALVLPRLAELRASTAVLVWPGESPRALRIGERHNDWELLAVAHQAPMLAVLERDFDQWGLIVYIGKDGPVATMRKTVGRINALPPAKAFPADYSQRILKSKDDILSRAASANGTEPSYESLADLLPPLRAYTFLGTTTSSEKLIVWPDGRLGTGIRHRKLDGLMFDPAAVLNQSWSSSLSTKQGLVGGYLPVIDDGFFDPATHSGFEEIALAADGEKPATYIGLRAVDGARTYWRLPGPQRLADGTEFYRRLLDTQRKWDELLGEGMNIDVPEARVSDASKAAMVRALISEIGSRPKYGVGVYSASRHDSFPPATILPGLCLLDWGYTREAKALLGYYLSNFVKPDGTFDYYGPALSEYGQMLTLAVRCFEVAGDTGWLTENLPALRRIAESLQSQLEAARGRLAPGSLDYGLLWGAAEADTYKEKRFYFAGNAWCWRGLHDFGELLSDERERNGDSANVDFGKRLLDDAASLRENLLSAMTHDFQSSLNPPFLPPAAGLEKPFDHMTENDLASYTNYRYWPEMLSAGILPARMEDAIIAYRTARGGEVAATTRLENVMDDWPYAHYAWGLLDAGQIDHYLMGFYGHLAFHQSPGNFTAYESVAIKGTSTRDYASDYCVPAQMVVPQMLRWMIAWEPWDGQDLWLARAAPRAWFRTGFAARRIPTRWGPASLEVAPAGDGLTAQIEMTSPHPDLHVHVCFRSAVPGSTPRVTVQGTKAWSWNARQNAVELWGPWLRVTVNVAGRQN